MDDETVQGVANTDPARLSIADDGFAHIQVAIDIKIGIDNACSGFYDRNTSGVAYKVDEAASAARYAQVDVPYGVQHLGCGLMGSRQQGDNVVADAKLLQHVMNETYGSLVGEVGIRTAFQHTGVATLETE